VVGLRLLIFVSCLGSRVRSPLMESSEAPCSAYRHTIVNKSGRKCRCSSGPGRKESKISRWRWYVSKIAYGLIGLAYSAVNQFRLPYVLEIRPSPEFGYEAGKNKLVNLGLGSDAESQVSFLTPGDTDAYDDQNGGNDTGYTGRQGTLLRLSGKIDIESRLTIGCAGAVLTYLQRRKAVYYLPGDTDANLAFRILTVEMFSLGGFMYVIINSSDCRN